MYDDVLTRFANGCLTTELDGKISQEVFAPLPTNPTMEEWERAKLTLQDLYHSYRRRNPCQMSAFAELHRCVYQVYCEAYDKLAAMPVQPAKPKRQRRTTQPKAPAPPSQQEMLDQIKSMITGAPMGKVVDYDPFK